MTAPPDPIRLHPSATPADWLALGVGEAELAPPRLVQAIGSRVWSEDGTEYVDFDNANGAVLLGHRDPAVVAAVRLARSGQDRRGPARYRTDVAERLLDVTPGGEACAFGANVAQALRAALATARRVTGRDRVFFSRVPGEAAGVRPSGPSFPLGDLEALERLMDMHGDETAALVLTLSPARAPPSGHLTRVRRLAERIGALLIFDESLAGFAAHEGGAQAQHGVRADLVVFGDSLANGMPIGALVGARALISAADAVEPLVADIATLAAAKAVLTKVRLEPVVAGLRIMGAEIAAETGRRLQQAGLDALVELIGDPAASVLRFHAPGSGADSRITRSLWTNACLGHRLFTQGAFNISYAHGEREIAVLLAAVDQAVDRLAQAFGPVIPSLRPHAAQSHR